MNLFTTNCTTVVSGGSTQTPVFPEGPEHTPPFPEVPARGCRFPRCYNKRSKTTILRLLRWDMNTLSPVFPQVTRKRAAEREIASRYSCCDRYVVPTTDWLNALLLSSLSRNRVLCNHCPSLGPNLRKQWRECVVTPSFRTPSYGFGLDQEYPPETDPPRKEPPEMVVSRNIIVAARERTFSQIESR